MSISEIYHIATIAKEKLLCEAEHKDHNLVRIVHHAQLYDMLLERYHEEEDHEEMEFEKEGATSHAEHAEWLLEEESEEDPEPSDDGWDSDAESTSTVESLDEELGVESKIQRGCAVGENEPYSVVEVFEIDLDDEED